MVILKDRILEFHPNTLECVRKELNLEKQSRIDEAVDILEDWVKKQEHFVKKDFSREYLERTLITAKGLVERAKLRMDKLCTFKTLMPNVYPKTIRKSDFDILPIYVSVAHLPKLTKEHYRVYVFKLLSDKFSQADLTIFYQYIMVVLEYVRRYDYVRGYVMVLDFTDVHVLNFIAKISPIELSQIFTLLTDGYGFRIKQIHLISASKMVDALVSLFKQVFSHKLGQRIQVHKNIEQVYQYVCKDVLPVEYGGTEKSLKSVNEKWVETVTDPEFIKYYEEMALANTNEALRSSEKFNEQYVGLPGSFRALSVD